MPAEAVPVVQQVAPYVPWIASFVASLFDNDGGGYSEAQNRMFDISGDRAELEREARERELALYGPREDALGNLYGPRVDALNMIMGRAQDVEGRSRGRIQARPFNPFGAMRDVQTFGADYPTPSQPDVGAGAAPSGGTDWGGVDWDAWRRLEGPGGAALDVNPYTQIGLMGWNPALTKIEEDYGDVDLSEYIRAMRGMGVFEEETNPYEFISGMGLNPNLTSRTDDDWSDYIRAMQRMEQFDDYEGVDFSDYIRAMERMGQFEDENPYEQIGFMGLNPNLTSRTDDDWSAYIRAMQNVREFDDYEGVDFSDYIRAMRGMREFDDDGPNPYELISGMGLDPSLTSRTEEDVDFSDYIRTMRGMREFDDDGPNPYEFISGMGLDPSLTSRTEEDVDFSPYVRAMEGMREFEEEPPVDFSDYIRAMGRMGEFRDEGESMDDFRTMMASMTPAATGMEDYLNAVIGAERVFGPRTSTARPQQEWLTDFIDIHGDRGLAHLRYLNDPEILEAIRSERISMPEGFSFSEFGVIRPTSGGVNLRVGDAARASTMMAEWIGALPKGLYAKILTMSMGRDAMNRQGTYIPRM